ncbi:guanylate cyclase [Niastella yeongjuensis]|uniref:Guanylate cyclase n=1 Tax=Niastella yeongjuensis TaxID=354355 RepID=A0A1V9EP10_9BACT|nr:adenylate/guanylate cyclase domain-containing protein [Niastella yeongjuensis]OQP47870.1 guanylate cyclase [Niastella yeongjuensis]SEP48236.1 TolB amino-terminal domain-containing protein [Niastella yeongjuensis]
MRQLAAILFADMTGYTALMQENEQLARSKRQRLKEVLEVTIPRFYGKILQYYGDGSLSIFNSAIDSVHAAIEIQQLLQQTPKVDLRIGIHTGDVTIEEEAIYGDGVNLASRIESLAVPGGVFVSEKVFDEIRNQQHIQTRELGYFELKNIKQPIRVFAIANNGIVVPGRHEVRGKTAAPNNRLAVLPFVNMSADPENEYFSDGITEELLNALTRVDGLQVTSRTSAFAFKGKNDDIRDIAIQLNVDKILEGSVRKAGNRVRITAQLINAADGFHIWSETYDRKLDDIFEVQDEISAIITNKLKENLTVSPKPVPAIKSSIKNITAYTHYLKGLHFKNKLTPGDTRKAIECFKQAIAIESAYAEAYAMVAQSYCALGTQGQMIPHTAFEIGHQYADKALELDDTIAEGHIAKAMPYLYYEWKWQDAYDALQKAIELNPGAVAAYDLLGFYYIAKGQKAKAVKVLEEAEQIDPLSPTIIRSLGMMYIFAERFDDGIVQAEKLLEMNPEMRSAIELKAWCIGMKGDWQTALDYFQEVHRLTGHPLKGLMGLGHAYARVGMTDKALECIQKLEQRELDEPDSVIDGDFAAIYLALGNLDKTFYYLNLCIDKRLGPVACFIEYPPYKTVKADPRFEQLKLRMGIPSGA